MKSPSGAGTRVESRGTGEKAAPASPVRETTAAS